MKGTVILLLTPVILLTLSGLLSLAPAGEPPWVLKQEQVVPPGGAWIHEKQAATVEVAVIPRVALPDEPVIARVTVKNPKQDILVPKPHPQSDNAEIVAVSLFDAKGKPVEPRAHIDWGDAAFLAAEQRQLLRAGDQVVYEVAVSKRRELYPPGPGRYTLVVSVLGARRGKQHLDAGLDGKAELTVVPLKKSMIRKSVAIPLRGLWWTDASTTGLVELIQLKGRNYLFYRLIRKNGQGCVARLVEVPSDCDFIAAGNAHRIEVAYISQHHTIKLLRVDPHVGSILKHETDTGR